MQMYLPTITKVFHCCVYVNKKVKNSPGEEIPERDIVLFCYPSRV